MVKIFFENKKLITTLIVALLTVFIMSFKENEEPVCVPNQETAIKIAEAIWLPIYGEKIYKYKPFIATLKEDKIWEVTGTLNDAKKGGTPYIEIQKSDCKILKVTHGK
ncbi:MAG: hypothetical protein RL308_1428 [Bacteroidota bacterium]|jgi:hypothetical protein